VEKHTKTHTVDHLWSLLIRELTEQKLENGRVALHGSGLVKLHRAHTILKERGRGEEKRDEGRRKRGGG
jgi:hypothetical protein